jgi:hypothetical protein
VGNALQRVMRFMARAPRFAAPRTDWFAPLNRVIGMGVAAITVCSGAPKPLASVHAGRPENRGFVISLVIHAPIGGLIGSLGDWRWTAVFVAALGPLSVSALT